MSTQGPAGDAAVVVEKDGFLQRIGDDFRSGNLGSTPVIIGLILISIFFSLTANNFFTAGNFTNIITQMVGTTMLAYGVVFVLLIGEIDLSISYVSGVAGVAVAELTLPNRTVLGTTSRAFWRSFSRSWCASRSERSRARSSP